MRLVLVCVFLLTCLPLNDAIVKCYTGSMIDNGTAPINHSLLNKNDDCRRCKTNVTRIGAKISYLFSCDKTVDSKCEPCARQTDGTVTCCCDKGVLCNGEDKQFETVFGMLDLQCYAGSMVDKGDGGPIDRTKLSIKKCHKQCMVTATLEKKSLSYKFACGPADQASCDSKKKCTATTNVVICCCNSSFCQGEDQIFSKVFELLKLTTTTKVTTTKTTPTTHTTQTTTKPTTAKPTTSETKKTTPTNHTTQTTTKHTTESTTTKPTTSETESTTSKTKQTTTTTTVTKQPTTTSSTSKTTSSAATTTRTGSHPTTSTPTSSTTQPKSGPTASPAGTTTKSSGGWQLALALILVGVIVLLVVVLIVIFCVYRRCRRKQKEKEREKVRRTNWLKEENMAEKSKSHEEVYDNISSRKTKAAAVEHEQERKRNFYKPPWQRISTRKKAKSETASINSMDGGLLVPESPLLSDQTHKEYARPTGGSGPPPNQGQEGVQTGKDVKPSNYLF